VKADVNRRRLLGAVAAAALLAGCEPGAEGGYARIVNRPDPVVPRFEHPDPPEVVPGSAVGAPAQRVIAASLPAGLTQEMVDEGQQLYGQVCGACHGQNGVGSPAGPGLNDMAWIQIGGEYDEIVAIINSGVANPRQYPGIMPPRGGGSFDDQQVRMIAAYVYALSRQGGA
jgi:mono/diheme cytochrome c family protein